MGAQGKIPMRTCVACRNEFPKRDLLRIVRTGEGEIALDFSGRLPGRGAYICKTEECVRLLCKRKPLAKAFSVPVPAEVYTRLEEEFLAAKN